jgi:hypothetical protein
VWARPWEVAVVGALSVLSCFFATPWLLVFTVPYMALLGSTVSTIWVDSASRSLEYRRWPLGGGAVPIEAIRYARRPGLFLYGFGISFLVRAEGRRPIVLLVGSHNLNAFVRELESAMAGS